MIIVNCDLRQDEIIDIVENIEMWIKIWYIYIKDMFNFWRGYVITE